jgi:integrase
MAKYQVARQQEGRSRPVPAEQWGRDFLEQIKHNFGDFLRLDLAQSSRHTYAVQQEQYKRFCVQLGEPQQPSAGVLARFIVGRALHNYRLSTIESGVAAVARWGYECGMEGLSSDPLVKHALRVAARVAVPSSGNQKLPLDAADLAKVVRMLQDRGDFIGDRDAALFLVGWAGMFRCSELAAMEWRSLQFVEGQGIMVYVPSSKTDQVGEGAWVFLAQAPAGKDPLLCPVRALSVLKQRVGSSGAVFTSYAGGSAISKSTIGARLKKALQEAGVSDPGLYSAHSLRRGGATHASKSGVSLRMVKVMGRWRSDVVREYLYASPGELWDAAAQLQAGLAG